jgi:hypothetical protein
MAIAARSVAAKQSKATAAIIYGVMGKGEPAGV